MPGTFSLTGSVSAAGVVTLSDNSQNVNMLNKCRWTAINHDTSSFSGTMKMQYSHDGGTNWADLQTMTADTEYQENDYVTNNLPDTYEMVRFNCTAYTSGSSTIRFYGAVM
jgi:hypothetical protein